MENLDQFDDMFENLFSSKEYELFNRISKHSIDILGLRKTGDVEILTEEEDGMVFKTITYRSFCGKYNFTKVFSYIKEEEGQIRLAEIEEELTEAVKREDYETAAKLKKEKEELMKAK